MEPKELIPEFHDIGKLINLSIDWIQNKLGMGKRLRHDFKCEERQKICIYDFEKVFGIEEPKTKTWKGIKDHHYEDKHQNPDIFLLKLADHIASSVSRAIYQDDKRKITISPEKDKPFAKRSVFKLWNQKTEEVQLIDSEEGVRELLNFIVQEDSIEKFYGRYLALLKKRPEDFKPPINITSVYSHLKTVGKIYRFLKTHAETEILGDSMDYKIKWKQGDGKERESATIKDAEATWLVKLVRSNIFFPQDPIKTSDINVFQTLFELTEKLKERDNILFQVSNQFLALLHPLENINDIIFPFLEKGFYIETEEALVNIGGASPTPLAIKRVELEKFEKELEKTLIGLQKAPEERQKEVAKREYKRFQNRFQEKILYDDEPEFFIPIPICELCQMRPAEKSRKDTKSGITENLCKKCFEIQDIPDEKKLKKLAEWQDGKVVWVNIVLDLDRLVSSLRELNIMYWKDLGIIDQLIDENIAQELFSKKTSDLSNKEKEQIIETKAEIRFSVLNEFQEDYNEFLKSFILTIQNKFSDNHFQYILDDLFCLKINKLNAIIDILREYDVLYDKFFPKLIVLDISPLMLSLSCAHAKFPFFGHWKILQSPKSDIYINLVGKGEVKASVKYLDRILKTTDFSRKTALHKLAQVAQISEKFAEVTLHDRRDRDYSTYHQFERPMGLGFHDILTLSEIAGD